MNIRKIIDKEKWKTHLYDSDDRVSTNDCHNDSLDRILIGVEKRIAELEAQLPRVVTPKNGTCMCGNVVRGFDPVHYGWKNNYCPKCGGKPNWEDA